MSKMSELHMELAEQADELGFVSLEEAIDNGYTVDYCERRLVKHECCEVARQQELAHNAWLEERDELLERLKKKQDKLKRMLCDDTSLYSLITDAINFIKKGEM